MDRRTGGLDWTGQAQAQARVEIRVNRTGQDAAVRKVDAGCEVPQSPKGLGECGATRTEPLECTMGERLGA